MERDTRSFIRLNKPGCCTKETLLTSIYFVHREKVGFRSRSCPLSVHKRIPTSYFTSGAQNTKADEHTRCKRSESFGMLDRFGIASSVLTLLIEVRAFNFVVQILSKSVGYSSLVLTAINCHLANNTAIVRSVAHPAIISDFLQRWTRPIEQPILSA